MDESTKLYHQLDIFIECIAHLIDSSRRNVIKNKQKLKCAEKSRVIMIGSLRNEYALTVPNFVHNLNAFIIQVQSK